MHAVLLMGVPPPLLYALAHQSTFSWLTIKQSDGQKTHKYDWFNSHGTQHIVQLNSHLLLLSSKIQFAPTFAIILHKNSLSSIFIYNFQICRFSGTVVSGAVTSNLCKLVCCKILTLYK